MDFYKRAELVLKRIPRGKVCTYGQLALLCGKPNNARQAGTALNRKIVEEVPAHRVVDSRGFLSGAGAFAQKDTQRLLLEAEGIEVSACQRVDLQKYRWKNTLRDAELLEEEFLKLNI